MGEWLKVSLLWGIKLYMIRAKVEYRNAEGGIFVANQKRRIDE